MAECLHQNIKIISVSYYEIPKGWEWLQEQDDIDMADYSTGTDRDKIVCDDCAEVLDE